jgi:hypothetical protein
MCRIFKGRRMSVVHARSGRSTIVTRVEVKEYSVSETTKKSALMNCIWSEHQPWKEAVQEWFKWPKTFYSDGIRNLANRWTYASKSKVIKNVILKKWDSPNHCEINLTKLKCLSFFLLVFLLHACVCRLSEVTWVLCMRSQMCIYQLINWTNTGEVSFNICQALIIESVVWKTTCVHKKLTSDNIKKEHAIKHNVYFTLFSQE